MTSPESSESENTYVIDVESGAEMARLMDQNILITKGMGGLFPERLDISDVHHVLDIACGPGGWVLEVAFDHPEMEVVGIDISQIMIPYARAQAKVQRLDNAAFRVMDARKPLDFPDNSFDLVNARFLFAVMPKEAWPRLLQECMRILRPGGIIRLTECEMPISNSPALEKLTALFIRALYVAKQSFSPDGRLVAITPVLGRLLHDIGYQDIQTETYGLNFSGGTEGHMHFYKDWKVAFKLAQPFLLKAGVASQEEIDEVYEQMLVEMYPDTFCMIWFLLSAWGKKAA